jgi:hypothetical protein
MAAPPAPLLLRGGVPALPVVVVKKKSKGKKAAAASGAAASYAAAFAPQRVADGLLYPTQPARLAHGAPSHVRGPFAGGGVAQAGAILGAAFAALAALVADWHNAGVARRAGQPAAAAWVADATRRLEAEAPHALKLVHVGSTALTAAKAGAPLPAATLAAALASHAFASSQVRVAAAAGGHRAWVHALAASPPLWAASGVNGRAAALAGELLAAALSGACGHSDGSGVPPLGVEPAAFAAFVAALAECMAQASDAPVAPLPPPCQQRPPWLAAGAASAQPAPARDAFADANAAFGLAAAAGRAGGAGAEDDAADDDDATTDGGDFEEEADAGGGWGCGWGPDAAAGCDDAPGDADAPAHSLDARRRCVLPDMQRRPNNPPRCTTAPRGLRLWRPRSPRGAPRRTTGKAWWAGCSCELTAQRMLRSADTQQPARPPPLPVRRLESRRVTPAPGCCVTTRRTPFLSQFCRAAGRGGRPPGGGHGAAAAAAGGHAAERRGGGARGGCACGAACVAA